MTKIIFATGNANKMREIKAILADLNMDPLEWRRVCRGTS